MADKLPSLCLEGWRLRMRYLTPGLDTTSARIYVDAFTAHVLACPTCTAWARAIDAAAEAVSMEVEE
jgi:hypothetical protein